MREEEAPKLILERIQTVAQRLASGGAGKTPAAKTEGAPAARTKTGKEGLYLRVPSMEAPVMKKVRLLLQIFDGSTPVYFRAVDSGKMLRAPQNLWTTAEPFVVAELERVLGSENVKNLV